MATAFVFHIAGLCLIASMLIWRNPLIDTSYRRMHNYLRLVRLDRKLTVPLALRSNKEHLEITAACESRDPDRAETALVAHFNAALQRHMGMFI